MGGNCFKILLRKTSHITMQPSVKPIAKYSPFGENSKGLVSTQVVTVRSPVGIRLQLRGLPTRHSCNSFLLIVAISPSFEIAMRKALFDGIAIGSTIPVLVLTLRIADLRSPASGFVT